MIKLKFFILLSVLVFLLIPTIIFASDITDAEYYGVITISNNSTVATNVATTCNISMPALIDGGYINSGANNCVIRNTAGSDIAFMPGVSGNESVMWVSSIGTDSYLSYLFYTNATGGKIRYFPSDSGMSRIDSVGLELGDNFTVEQKGWIDTTQVSANLTNKTDAFRTYISATGNITSSITGGGNVTAPNISSGEYTIKTAIVFTSSNTTETLRPNAAGDETNITTQYPDSGSHWDKVDEVTTDESATRVSEATKPAYKRDFYNLADHSEGAGTINNVKVYARCRADSVGDQDSLKIVIKSGTGDGAPDTDNESSEISVTASFVDYSNTWATNPATGTAWTWDEIDKLQAGISIRNADSVNILPTLCTQVYVEVEYLPISYLKIYVDDVEKDSTALGGASVPDNSETWTYWENMGGYCEFTKTTIDGVLQQHIEWEYTTGNFTDLSGNSHDATPTYRTTSSDANVSGEMISFQPIAEAQAPSFSLATTGGNIVTENLTTTGTFTETPSPKSFPFKAVIEAVATASNTPAQLPFIVLAGFVIIAFSLSATYFLKKHGSGSLFIKVGVVTAVMGIFIALRMLDFWLLIFFLIIAVALMFASKQGSYT